MHYIKITQWELFVPPPNKSIIGFKWIFQIKRNPYDSIASYKARLVAKSFNQKPGVYIHETFSFVVKPATIILVLHLDVNNNWSMSQIDVNNAFLQG